MPFFFKTKRAKSKYKQALLKSSFKKCYSILDTIGILLLKALEIDADAILKERRGNNKLGKIPKIYFLNMWDLDLITQQYFDHNQFLYSLFSISKDLDRTEYAALKGFKDLRNSMEHEILKIGDTKLGKKEKGISYVSEETLRESCKLLLVLTKSSIFSFVYFIRRQSKIIELNNADA